MDTDIGLATNTIVCNCPRTSCFHKWIKWNIKHNCNLKLSQEMPSESPSCVLNMPYQPNLPISAILVSHQSYLDLWTQSEPQIYAIYHFYFNKRPIQELNKHKRLSLLLWVECYRTWAPQHGKKSAHGRSNIHMDMPWSWCLTSNAVWWQMLMLAW